VSTTIGILGYQGCIAPHEALLTTLGADTLRVRTPDHLARVDGLIIPGGESTTMLRFLKSHAMIALVREFAKRRPVWGICAGAILAASEVCNPSQDSLELIDIVAHRNFYGSQLDSFSAHVEIDLFDRPIEAKFIRAPLLSAIQPRVHSKPLRVHASHASQPVFFSQGHVWACSFHVELGHDPALHQRFVELCDHDVYHSKTSA